MAVAAADLRWLTGFLVADRDGKVVGRVECPMYGTAPDVPDALAVRSGFQCGSSRPFSSMCASRFRKTPST